MPSDIQKPFSDMSILSSFTIEELESVIANNSSLRGYLQGYLSEVALQKQLSELEGVTDISKIPDQAKQKGDISLMYRGTPLTIEVKSLLTSSVKHDPLTEQWQGTVSFKSSDRKEIYIEGVGKITTCAVPKGGFDILAISIYPVNNTWDFLFIENEYLPEIGPDLPGLISLRLKVDPSTTPCITSNLKQILDDAREKKLLLQSFLSV